MRGGGFGRWADRTLRARECGSHPSMEGCRAGALYRAYEIVLFPKRSDTCCARFFIAVTMGPCSDKSKSAL